MQAPLPNHSMPIHHDVERHREQRGALGARASVGMTGHGPAEALLSDVSAFGCCVKSAADWLRPGRRIAIGLPGGETMDSIVRWSGAGLAGLELLRPAAADQPEWLALID
jgi:hypothetical protein